MVSDNQKQIRKELQALKRNELIDGDGMVIAYEDASGLPRSVPGDDESARLKTPPFLTDVARWIPATTVPATPYSFTPIVDVTKRRLIEVYIEYTAPAGESGELSLVPRIRRSEDPDELYPVGAVNAAPTVVTLPAPFAAAGPAGASRLFFISEYRTTVIPATVVYRNTLGFDVSAFAAFQLGFAAISGTGATLRLDYAFSD